MPQSFLGSLNIISGVINSFQDLCTHCRQALTLRLPSIQIISALYGLTFLLLVTAFFALLVNTLCAKQRSEG